MAYSMDDLMNDMKALMRQRRLKVIDSLMSGNDTQCFTTREYANRQKTIYPTSSDSVRRDMDAMWDGEYGLKLARFHLENCDVVKEVSTDIWTWKNNVQ